jgi:hypothetical protein
MENQNQSFAGFSMTYCCGKIITATSPAGMKVEGRTKKHLFQVTLRKKSGSG